MDDIKRYMREQEKIYKQKIALEKSIIEYNNKRKSLFNVALIELLHKPKQKGEKI